MFKPNTLLKVVSILLIIFGALGGIITAIGYATIGSLDKIPGMTDTLIEQAQAAYSPVNMAVAAVSTIFCILPGILGLMGRNAKAAMISMIIYILIGVVTLALSIPEAGFSFLDIVTFILPVLYLWGLYQSKE